MCLLNEKCQLCHLLLKNMPYMISVMFLCMRKSRALGFFFDQRKYECYQTYLRGGVCIQENEVKLGAQVKNYTLELFELEDGIR